MTGDAPGVLIAEDDVLLREGLARLLADEGFNVIDQAGNASALLALAHRHRPDLVIVDIRMPPTHTTEGLDAARTIRAEMPETAVVVLSAHAEVEQATDLLACGERSGYLLKSRVTDIEEFIATLRRIIGGAAVVDPALIQQLLAARRAEDPLEGLSRARARSLGPDGRGTLQRRYRAATVGDRVHCREARPQHFHEAAHCRDRRRSPAGPRSSPVPRVRVARSRGRPCWSFRRATGADSG